MGSPTPFYGQGLLRLVIALLLIPALLLAGSASAAVPAADHDTTEAVSYPAPSASVVIVQLVDPPIASAPGTKPADGERLDIESPEAQAYQAELEAKQQEFIEYLASAAPSARATRQWTVVYNGLAVELNGTDTSVLLAGPHVAALTFSRFFLPTMNVTHSVIGTETLWKQVGGASKAGLGIKAGIIDSGIDHNHPFLTDSSLSMPAGFPKCDLQENCQFTSNKVIVAREYPKSPDYTAEDKNGHGTHVSGTVAGVNGTSAPNVGGTLSGVAPKAYLGNYNVFPGDTGSASEFDIIDALEDATRDGMDVLNMSLGGGVLPGPDPLADAVNSTVDAGIVVAVAAGNSGPGSETISSPGVAEKALTVGATTNPHFIGIAVGVTDAGTPADLTSFGAAVGDFNAYDTPVSARYVDWNAIDGLGNGEACEPTLHPDLQGAIALIRRGTCTFTTKVRNAENAGAVGVLIFNQVAGDPVAMGHDGTEPKPVIPAVMVAKDKGLAMREWYATNGGGHVTVDGSSKSEFITENVDIIAGFSSRGPTPYTYRIKPDVSAPGVNIYSSVPGGDFAMYQGTSMASPHVAGASAVLRQLNPKWSPQQIKSALSSTAKRPVWDHVNGTSAVTVMHRGAGRIDLSRVGSVPASFNPSSVSYGKKAPLVGFTEQRTITVTNTTKQRQTYAISVEQTVSDLGLTVGISTTSLTLGAGQIGSVTLTLTASTLAEIGAYEGDVVFATGKGSSAQKLYVPYWILIDA